ncbi:MAG: RNA polymerase sigma factor RpoD/SigA [Proteobacteria bacterium]|nr:RNA polymerase sigma factor RpoD/SigA [Pseudomonadota bacterium]
MSRNSKITRSPRRNPALRLAKRTRSTTVLRPARLAKSTRRNVLVSSPAPAKPAAPVATSVPRDADLHSANPHVDNREMPTSLSRYMRDAVQEPLLTVQEEIQLAARIKRGDDAARDRMIRANLRLVVKIAREYEGLGLPLLDLINEGNIGLMKAVERFDPAKGGKLSTYGAWWIKQSIRRALTNQSKTIRLPVHAMERLWEIKKVTARFEEEIGREPTNSELAAELGTSVSRIAAIREANVRPASLDAPIGSESDSSRLGDVIEDMQATTPYEDLEKQTLRETVAELLHKLPEREVIILKQRFGLDDSDSKITLRQIGKRFGVTRERIRQLQNLALQKLRAMMAEREALPEAA